MLRAGGRPQVGIIQEENQQLRTVPGNRPVLCSRPNVGMRLVIASAIGFDANDYQLQQRQSGVAHQRMSRTVLEWAWHA
jgi:hypothetical protein